MAIKKRPVSPRQRMINLMYVVLMAMLTLNVSTDVFNGFSVIDESLRRSTANASRENQIIYDGFDNQMQTNPTKTRAWYDKAQEVRRISDSLYVFADMMKTAVIREADGDDSDMKTLINKEDLEAAAQVMLAPVNGKGHELYMAINSFRERMIAMINDPIKKEVIAGNLSTEVPETSEKKTWEEYMFDYMPAAAAVTMLTKLQNDIRYAEGEVLHALMTNIDAKDVRVNNLSAFVIPNSQTIVKGEHFTAHIGLAAIDTTQIPDVYINNKKVSLKNGMYDILCTKPGDYTLKGWLQTTDNSGGVIRRDFSQQYKVVEPTATVSADMMNVLYAGYENPISISVPGVPLTAVTPRMEGGQLTQTAAGRYMVRPLKVGQDVKITVFAKNTGVEQRMAEYTFKVRKLPEPTPYIDIRDEKGNSDRYHGGTLAKAKMTKVTRVDAAVDDGILHIPFKVLSFEMVFFDNMGNAVPMTSDGPNISAQQKETIRKLAKGRRFYISRLKAIGPDGIERKLNTSMEVILR